MYCLSFWSLIEKELIEIYAPDYAVKLGIPQAKARKAVKEILKAMKKEAIKDGTYSRPSNYGDRLLELEKTNEKTKEMLSEARREGATDDDIRQYWNLHELERRMVDLDDDENNMAMVLMLIEKGHSPEEASNEVRKMIPIYGQPENAPKLVGDYKPLPIELKDRVNSYNIKRNNNDPEVYKKELKQFSSFNAFIRSEIKNGNVQKLILITFFL